MAIGVLDSARHSFEEYVMEGGPVNPVHKQSVTRSVPQPAPIDGLGETLK